jgi:hypothetical protein
MNPIRKSNSLSMVGIVSLLIAGCAAFTPHQAAWNKAGASNEEFSRDRYACLKDSEIPPMYNGYGGVITTNYNLFDACMGVHGWRYQ